MSEQPLHLRTPARYRLQEGVDPDGLEAGGSDFRRRDGVEAFSPETVTLMGRVCDAAWREVQDKLFFPSQWEAETFRRELAERVMMAVAGGERDATRLKVIALEQIDA